MERGSGVICKSPLFSVFARCIIFRCFCDNFGASLLYCWGYLDVSLEISLFFAIGVAFYHILGVCGNLGCCLIDLVYLGLGHLFLACMLLVLEAINNVFSIIEKNLKFGHIKTISNYKKEVKRQSTNCMFGFTFSRAKNDLRDMKQILIDMFG